MDTAVPPTGDALAAAVRRNTRLLAAAQGLLYISAPIILATGGPAAVRLTGRASGVGLMIAVYFFAAAVSALLAGPWMDRHGRRPGLLFGHATVLVGALAASATIAAGSSAGLFVAAAILGVGAGIALLGRGAVADMYPPERRARAVGLMLAASTVGAVGGAPLAAVVQSVSDGMGVDRLVTPWLMIPLFEVLAIAAIAAIRPDPRDLAVVAGPADPALAAPDEAGDARPRRELLALPPFRAALVAAVVAQATMVGVMAVAPVAVHQHGGGDAAVSVVLAVHFLGMFALMPLIGAALDRWGRRRGLLAAALVSLIGVPLGGLGTASALTSLALFCSGLGWAGAYLAATAVVSDVTRPTERAGALGMTDLLVSLCSGVGGLLGGIVLEVGGFRLVTLAAGLLFVPVIALVLPLREASPGRWGTVESLPSAGP